ncbi:MAG TPA: hypothetical protein DIC45_02030 [Comamonadaceae bacterium]|nr:hypothetical protein [Comamonadaceae bacterium]
MAAPAAPARHVICMKWGRKYGPEYVNRLYAMVRRHLGGDFNFVCLTDDAAGIRPEVQCLPIPPLDLPAGIPERGWNKLATFSADLHGLRGTALDPFGKTEERRTERALIQEYRACIEELLGSLTPERLALAVEIARIPEDIRGYGHVKERHLAAARKKWFALMDRWRNGAAAPATAQRVTA